MMTLKQVPRQPLPPDLDTLVARLDAELRQRAGAEQARARAAHGQSQAAAAAKAARAEEHYRKLGLDVGGIAAFHRMLAVEDSAARGVLRHTALPAPRRDEPAADPEDAATVPPFGAILPGQRQLRLTSGHLHQRSASARGFGTGWYGSGAQETADTDFWHFPFAPPESARYTFWPTVAFRGMYIVQAANDFWTARAASVAVDFYLHYWQSGWKRARRGDPAGGGGNVFTRGGASVDQCVGMEWEHRPTGAGIYEVPLVAGEPAVVTVELTLRATARGDGACAEISAGGEGAYLACRSLAATIAPFG